MEIVDIIELAEQYSRLGGAVQEQLRAFLDDTDTEVNPNALRMAKEFLQAANDRGVEGADWALDAIDDRLSRPDEDDDEEA